MPDISSVADVARLAQSQYYNRPADQRFASLNDLEAAVLSRRQRSIQLEADLTTLRVEGSSEGLAVHAGVYGATPTHYAFSQFSTLLRAPGDFLRRLGEAGHHDLVAKNLTTALALRQRDLQQGIKVLMTEEADDLVSLTAVTSPSYGRIWDADVVAATKSIVESHPEFTNPKEWGGRPGGLYASDRDVFMFHIDGGSIVDGGPDLRSGGDRDQLHRGFFVWNSEVGAATMGIAAFLFRMVCGNHMIHGIEGVRLLRIRHTSGGPERFVSEAIPALHEYVNASAAPLESAIRKAKALLLPPTQDDTFTTYFTTKGFTKAEVRRAVAYAEAEEGGARTLWQLQQGFTRAARDLAYIDARCDLERRAGQLFKLVN